MKGVRIHAIVRELNNENIDVINYSDNPSVYIQRSLAPAKIKSITIDEGAKTATILVDKDQASLAIGRNGQNIRLAIQLTGYQINLVKEGGDEEYDMDLEEFREELGIPLYERLVDEGYTTIRRVLEAPVDDLLEIDGLTEDKIKTFKVIMQRELEEAEIEEENDEEELAGRVSAAAEPKSSDNTQEDTEEKENK
jgi:N utilization substance protein A